MHEIRTESQSVGALADELDAHFQEQSQGGLLRRKKAPFSCTALGRRLALDFLHRTGIAGDMDIDTSGDAATHQFFDNIEQQGEAACRVRTLMRTRRKECESLFAELSGASGSGFEGLLDVEVLECYTTSLLKSYLNAPKQ